MARFFTFLLFLAVGVIGFWMGGDRGSSSPGPSFIPGVYPEKEVPIVEHKPLCLILYAHNQAPWVQRSLHSIFEQEYDSYRVIFIDDGSTDGTADQVRQFVIDNNQDHRVILISNETCLGATACLYRTIDSCLDREIAIPMDAKDWLPHPYVFSRLNAAYQNSDVWMTFGKMISYPSYQTLSPPSLKRTNLTEKGGYQTLPLDFPASFYAALFKQVRLSDLFERGEFLTSREAYLIPLLEMSGGRVRVIEEPLVFSNTASPAKLGEKKRSYAYSGYAPLAAFPLTQREGQKADVLLFSFDRPLQLYSSLESIQRYLTGYEKISVIYRASTASFSESYEQVKNAFPQVHFIAQSDNPKKDFKPHVLKALFGSPSQYILFGVDDIIMTDFVDLKQCMSLLDRTKAYGFYLRFGKHIRQCYQNKGRPQELPPSVQIAANTYAWDIKKGEFDWGFPTSLDMTLYRKEDIKEPFTKMKFKTPNSLEFIWASKNAPKTAIGLYFERAKMVNVPLNIVAPTGNPHMNFLTTEQLLTKFKEGLKIDIEPLYKVENASPHYDYIPEFVPR